MAAERVSYGPPPQGQSSLANPALSEQAFARGRAEASIAERRGMTAAGAYAKTGVLLALLVAAMAFGWSQVEIVEAGQRLVAVSPPWTWLAFLLTFILGVTGAFAVKAAPVIAPLYALTEGALLGIASHYFNLEFDGIVLQAVAATLAVFAATLALFSAGIIRVSARFATGVSIAISALFVLYLTTWMLSLFGVNIRFLSVPTPLGILLSLGVVLLGALTLPLNFEFVRQQAAAGAPKHMEWYSAYGLLLSIIWMYVSILRFLALLRMARE